MIACVTPPPPIPPGPFYLPRGEHTDASGTAVGEFEATPSTTGPWYADAQHMGPPSALLARALERLPGGAGARIARVTVEVLGMVPAGPVTVTAQVERPGRTIELLAATMRAGGRDVLRARAWRLAASDTAVAARETVAALPGPDAGTVRAERPHGWLPGFLDAVEWSWLDGVELGDLGPARAWVRMRVPLVEGEQPAPLQRLMVAADCANGIAAPLDVRDWLFVNTELTVHLHRAPAGEWIGVDAATVVGPDGLGTCAATLFDEAGHTGRIAQALTVRSR
ncbi:thioesterase family protein [Pseudonocardia sp. C8]|uniref:thioesterase family protein n=1 Tax=Pseudonocardia sp. C8 TaxID=2762759 RepID=UPI00164276D8|nr:thioesterase family protein [Pseudonocardia sp. C8]MBC3192086.1 thioesterase family protein [Pseudonocardia sp. C8]